MAGLQYLTNGAGHILVDGDGEPLVEGLLPPPAPGRVDAERPIPGQPSVSPAQPAGATTRIADALTGNPMRGGV